MDIYSNKNVLKIIFLVFALFIGVGTILYTESFLKDLRAEEIRRARLLVEAIDYAQNGPDSGELIFVMKMIEANNTIPIIVTNDNGKIVAHRNIGKENAQDDAFLRKQIEKMSEQNDPIIVEFGEGRKNIVYYKESILLTKLRFYPIVLLSVIGLFIGIAYLAFSSSRKAEQNRVWNGMAKETAHQIGTPLSSLMGWIEILHGQNTDKMALEEMEKDVARLETITDRFSKIGSIPQMKEESIAEVVSASVDYLERRMPKKISLNFTNHLMAQETLNMNKQLFGWVLENLVRNAMDAIQGEGSISIVLEEQNKWIKLDVTDSGKGIAIAQQKAVFRPGYTTKSRGWGLGLSLAKRIIGEYHKGKIFVAQSEIGNGSTFRIMLPKQ